MITRNHLLVALAVMSSACLDLSTDGKVLACPDCVDAGEDGGPGPDAGLDAGDAGSGSDAGSDAGASDAGPPDLLATSPGCPDSLFTVVDLEEGFSTATFAQDWAVGYVAPVVSGNTLVYGPFDNTDGGWWNDYGTATTRTGFGDVMLCVRYQTTPVAGRANTLELGLRGDSSGMAALDVNTGQAFAQLGYRQTNSVWPVGVRAVTPTSVGVSQTLEIALLATGNQFYAELRNATDGGSIFLNVAVPGVNDAGPAALVGWDLGSALTVDRVVLGTPTAAALEALTAP